MGVRKSLINRLEKFYKQKRPVGITVNNTSMIVIISDMGEDYIKVRKYKMPKGADVPWKREGLLEEFVRLVPVSKIDYVGMVEV